MHDKQIDLDPMFSLVSMDAVTPPSPPITSADATSNNDTSADSTSSSADTSSANDGTCVTADPTPKTTHSDVGTASASTSTIGPRRASVGDDPKSWRMFLVEGEQVDNKNIEMSLPLSSLPFSKQHIHSTRISKQRDTNAYARTHTNKRTRAFCR